MTELMGGHLTKAENGIVTFEAMVVGLFLIVIARLNTTRLGRSELFKSSSVNGVPLLVLPTVRYHFVGVCADEITLHAVEMRRFVLLTI